MQPEALFPEAIVEQGDVSGRRAQFRLTGR
jgi:hypothetical protein